MKLVREFSRRVVPEFKLMIGQAISVRFETELMNKKCSVIVAQFLNWNKPSYRWHVLGNVLVGERRVYLKKPKDYEIEEITKGFDKEYEEIKNTLVQWDICSWLWQKKNFRYRGWLIQGAPNFTYDDREMQINVDAIITPLQIPENQKILQIIKSSPAIPFETRVFTVLDVLKPVGPQLKGVKKYIDNIMEKIEKLSTEELEPWIYQKTEEEIKFKGVEEL